MTRFLWGTCWVPLLMLVAPLSAQEKTPEGVRLVTVKAFEDAANTWREHSGLNLKVKVADLNQALRMLAGGEADFTLISGTLTPGQTALVTSTQDNVVLTYPAGWEALSLLVHPSNPIPSFSLTAARSLFAASECISSATPFLAWGDLPGSTGDIRSASIEVFLPQPKSREEGALVSLLLDGCKLRGDCQVFTTDAAIERCVAEHPNALGVVSRLRYIPQARVVPVTNETGKNTALLEVKAHKSKKPEQKSLHAPENKGETRKDTRKARRSSKFMDPSRPLERANDFMETHPLAREITLVSRRRFPKDSPQAAFVQYAISGAGQVDLARIGLVPVWKD